MIDIPVQHNPLVLGFDVGGTSTKLGLVNARGEISHFRRFPTDAEGINPGPFLTNLADHIKRLMAESPLPVLGIGMSLHGFVDDERRGSIFCPNTPALVDVNLRRSIEDAFQLPVTVNSDLTAHALAEYHFGSGRGKRRFLCMAMGTGLGAGVVIGGEPLRYVGGCAGDTGHIILEPGGPSCAAGCKGCAEALCGVEGIERLSHERYGQAMQAHNVIAAARRGDDPIAAEVMRQIGRYVGQALASLSVIYLPELIALTGGTAEAGDVLLEACRSRFEELVGDYHRSLASMEPGYHSGVKIVLSELRSEAGVIGAAVELLQPYLAAGAGVEEDG